MSVVFRFIITYFAFYSVLISAGAIDRSAAVSDKVERDFQTIRDLSHEPPPRGITVTAQLEWYHERNNRLHELALKFLAENPQHPLRWDVVVIMRFAPSFTKEIEVDGALRIVRDSDRQKAWFAQYQAMIEDLLRAKDASDASRRTALEYLIQTHGARLAQKGANAPASELSYLSARFEELEKEFPNSVEFLASFRTYSRALDAIDPKLGMNFLLSVKARHPTSRYPDPQIREIAEGRLRLVLGEATPVWIQLAALDGRLVDTSALRGKVVLIAIFPVTLVEDVHVLETLYQNYHAKGLEVIHVTTSDDVTSRGNKLDRGDSAAVADFEKWPWKVVYDGAGVMGQLASRYGINSIPTWLVIARDGRFVANPDFISTNKLDAMIRMELALSEGAQKP